MRERGRRIGTLSAMLAVVPAAPAAAAAPTFRLAVSGVGGYTLRISGRRAVTIRVAKPGSA